MTPRRALPDTLKASRHALLAAADGLPREWWGERPGADEWSVLEVVAHLEGVDQHWLAQALAMRDNPGHLFVHFDDTAWKAAHEGVRWQPPEEVLAKIDASHRAVLSALAGMSEADLDRPGLHPRGIPYTVRDVFLRFPPHDEGHRRQIEEIRSALARSAGLQAGR